MQITQDYFILLANGIVRSTINPDVSGHCLLRPALEYTVSTITGIPPVSVCVKGDRSNHVYCPIRHNVVYFGVASLTAEK